MAKPILKRILLKISGESFKGDRDSGIDPKAINYMANEIKTVVKLGIEIGVVVGGGNIWRGTLDGEDWISLTDYQQVLGVTFLRKIGDRILFANNKGFYYSDNEGLILNEAEGLDITLNWESIKRTIIKANKKLAICAIRRRSSCH